MINACTAGISIDGVKFLLALASFSLAVLTIFLLRRSFSSKAKIGLIYAHLSSLFFPPVLFTTNFACGWFCLPCFENPLGLALLALPTTLIASAIAGFVVIPGYFLISRKTFLSTDKGLKSFLANHSARAGIKAPGLYIIDLARPLAFSFRSFRSAIFLSVGMVEILRKRELEAVLLHELFHVKSGSSIFKFSSALMRLSPFSLMKNFDLELGSEEEGADSFVREVQRTSRHLAGAKRKIHSWTTRVNCI